MRIEDVRVGMKVVPHSKVRVEEEYGSFEEYLEECCSIDFLRKHGYLIVNEIDDENEVRLGDGRYGDWFRASDFEPYVESKVQQLPQPVDLSTVKVGEKYVIERIDGNWNEGFNYEGKCISQNGFESGDIVLASIDAFGDVCLMTEALPKYYSFSIAIFNKGKLTLYPYTEPSQAPQQEQQLILAVTPENENISVEGLYDNMRDDLYNKSIPSQFSIDYARKYYDNYIRVRKVYLEQFYAINKILCHTEDELEELLISNIGWTDSCVQDKIVRELGLTPEGEVLNILFDCFMEMVEYDVVIDKLREGGFII